MDDPLIVWRQTHPPGQPAVFGSGEELRCVAAKDTGRGAQITCGQTLRIWVGNGCRVLLRPLMTNSARTIGTGLYRCRNCHNASEVRELAGYREATG